MRDWTKKDVKVVRHVIDPASLFAVPPERREWFNKVEADLERGKAERRERARELIRNTPQYREYLLRP